MLYFRFEKEELHGFSESRMSEALKFGCVPHLKFGLSAVFEIRHKIANFATRNLTEHYGKLDY